jgi:hypothetical protein
LRKRAHARQLVGAAAPGAASSPASDDDVYALAKAQFDLKEYLRAAHTLRARHLASFATGSLARPSSRLSALVV